MPTHKKLLHKKRRPVKTTCPPFLWIFDGVVDSFLDILYPSSLMVSIADKLLSYKSFSEPYVCRVVCTLDFSSLQLLGTSPEEFLFFF